MPMTLEVSRLSDIARPPSDAVPRRATPPNPRCAYRVSRQRHQCWGGWPPNAAEPRCAYRVRPCSRRTHRPREAHPGPAVCPL